MLSMRSTGLPIVTGAAWELTDMSTMEDRCSVIETVGESGMDKLLVLCGSRDLTQLCRVYVQLVPRYPWRTRMMTPFSNALLTDRLIHTSSSRSC